MSKLDTDVNHLAKDCKWCSEEREELNDCIFVPVVVVGVVGCGRSRWSTCEWRMENVSNIFSPEDI
jgi:hypothetical protein